MTPLKLGGGPSTIDTDLAENAISVGSDAQDLRQRSLRGSFVTVLSQGGKFAIQLGSQIILARLLFPAEFGLVAMAYPVIAFVQVFNDFGLGQAIIQRPTLVQEQVSALFWFNIIVSCALACTLALLAPIAGWIYGEPRVAHLIIALGVTLPVAAISITPNALLARHMQFSLMARNEILSMLLGSIITIGCALGGLSYWSLVLGTLANLVAGNLLAWSASKWRPTRPKFSASVWSDAKFGGNITLSNLSAFITTSGDNVIVGMTTGKVSLGLYDRSYNLVVRPIGQMMAPLSRVAVPWLSRLNGQSLEYRSAYLQMVRTATLVIVPGLLLCITNGAVLISVFLGSRWSAAAPIFSWICVGGLTSGIYQSAVWQFLSQDRSGELKTFAALAAIINVVSYLVGAFWGVIGIAAAAAIGFVFLTTPLMVFGAVRRGPVRSRDIVWCSTPFIVAGLCVYLTLAFAVRKMSLDGLPRIIVLSLLSYGLFCGLSMISNANRQLLWGALQVLRGLLPARASVGYPEYKERIQKDDR